MSKIVYNTLFSVNLRIGFVKKKNLTNFLQFCREMDSNSHNVVPSVSAQVPYSGISASDAYYYAYLHLTGRKTKEVQWT